MVMLLSAGGSFTEALPAIAPVNPLGCALLYARMTGRRAQHQRVVLARRIAINVGLVLLVAIWAGAVLMGLFGVGLPAPHGAAGLLAYAVGTSAALTVAASVWIAYAVSERALAFSGPPGRRRSLVCRHS